MINLLRSKLARKPAKTTEQIKDSEIFIRLSEDTAYGKCRRQSVYGRNNFQADSNQDIEVRYLHYDVLKEYYLGYLKEEKLIDELNFEYTNDDWELAGSYDARINKTGINIAIISSRASRFVAKEPRPQDIIKASIGLITKDLEKILLIYIPVDGKDAFEYKLEYRDEKILLDNTIYEKFDLNHIKLGIEETKKTIKGKQLPGQDYEYRYSRHKAKFLYQVGKISELQYKKFRTGNPIGDFQCKNCKFLRVCYNLQGRI